MLVSILSSSSLHCDYKFQPDWPSSGVEVVGIKESAAHCNAVPGFLQQPVHLMLAD
jgi:hypothetical protein